MMKRLVHSHCIGLALGVALTVGNAYAGIVASRSGPMDSANGNNPFAISWTQSSTFDNVSITADLYNLSGVDTTGTFYLLDALGPGTTAAVDEIARVSVSSSSAGTATFSLFSGLTLGPGTYYLTYEYDPQTASLFWSEAVPGATVTLDASVSALTNYVPTGPADPYAPATDFTTASRIFPIFSITSADPRTVPEPATWGLLAMALASAFGVRGRSKNGN